MFCFYYKWKISQAVDLGEKHPDFVNSHLHSCASCLQFSRLSQTLSEKLSQESPHSLQEQKHSLKEKIKLALVQEKKPEWVRRHVPRYIPVLAASIFVLVVTIGVILHLNNPSVYNKNKTPINQLSKISISRFSLQGILGSVESPMEKEMKNLTQSMKSTAEFLFSCLDFNLDKPTDRF